MAIQTVKTGAAVNDGTGDDARSAFTKINQNFTDTTHAASRLVGPAAGNVMEVGAFGLGLPKDNPSLQVAETGFSQTGVNLAMGIYKTDTEKAMLILPTTDMYNPMWRAVSRNNTNEYSPYYAFYTQRNTTVDPNGFIKNASPIVSLYADKIELNDEAKQQTITFEKLGVGDYLVKGSLGFAQEGWYIEMPKDANGNVLVAVVYEQLANNDISVKTYAKMFDPDTGDIVANTAKPRDIPATRWIDLRLQALPQPDITPTDNTVTTNA